MGSSVEGLWSLGLRIWAYGAGLAFGLRREGKISETPLIPSPKIVPPAIKSVSQNILCPLHNSLHLPES